MALFTITFTKPDFTTQIELQTPQSLEHNLYSLAWFAQSVASYLDIPHGQNAEMFQLIQLGELTNVWSGFFGHNGKYSAFTLVKTAVAR
jgi:hypothetical protein